MRTMEALVIAQVFSQRLPLSTEPLQDYRYGRVLKGLGA